MVRKMPVSSTLESKGLIACHIHNFYNSFGQFYFIIWSDLDQQDDKTSNENYRHKILPILSK